MGIRMNPYLIDYERERQRRMQSLRGAQTRSAGSRSGRIRQTEETAKRQVRNIPGQATAHDRKARAAARARRRRIRRIRRFAAGVCLVSFLLIAALLLMTNGNVSAEEKSSLRKTVKIEEEQLSLSSGSTVQGLPAEQFAAHPAWTENFLTPNEYSRPGEPLEEVKNIFVHYTANPGTSAAQNRSYFEQQKDVHQASVSAHFIIGYEGEIIQCLPLDEIGYAVQTRNYDSISIECCYKAKDGSFTQETYDSLVALLQWLVDVYDLDTDDILRHYDCGGKKCPLYYTEHEDAWEQLKEDVAAGQKK